MPIYEYKCAECGHHLEAIQKMSDGPLTECPQCKRPELKRLVSAAGFQLKGSGWYATDFKNGGQKKKDAKTEKTDSASEPGTPPPEKKAHACGGGGCGCA
jgi:putative FmdB family regulatory protein